MSNPIAPFYPIIYVRGYAMTEQEQNEGGYLFQDTMIVKLTPPLQEDEKWIITFDWQSGNLGGASQTLVYKTLKSGKLQMAVPFGSKNAPGIAGKLRFVVSAWND
jgi:hypothetical protein